MRPAPLKNPRRLPLSSDGKYEKIAVLDNEFEAQMLESILIEREIPYQLKS